MQLDDILKPIEGRASLNDVARLSGLHINHLYDLRNGRNQATPATMARVRFAVSRIMRRQTEGEIDFTALYRMSLALAALAFNLDPAQVQVSDPSAKKSNAKNWRDASDARRLAQYVLNTGLGLRQADVARAAGVTKQAINQAAAEIENKRENPEFDALVMRVETWIIGVGQ